MNLYPKLWGILVAILVLSFPSFSQSQYNLDDFQGLRSEGPIPSDFLTGWNEKAKERFKASLSGNESEEEVENLEHFWVANHYVLADLLTNGNVSFGDPISIYLNTIKDNILSNQPELARDIRIYVLKSPIVNAYCTFDGILFINSGLISRVKTEAELAFVICHEISHYTESHSLEGYYENLKILENDDKFEDLSRLEKVNYLLKRGKDDEFEADEKGLELLLNSEYSINGVEGTLDFLHNSYLPFVENRLSRNFLATKGFNLPDVFFLDNLAPITKEEDYFDETHSHPNIFKRRMALKRFLKTKGDSKDRKEFVQSQELFEEIKMLSRFESVRQEVRNGYYGDAVYHITYLKQKYPTSKFLDMSMAKSLYGLGCFKAINSFKSVARSFNKVEGESQQLHYVLRQFDRKQMLSLVLSHLLEIQKKYPEETALQIYIDEITMHMLVNARLNAEDFKVESETQPVFLKRPEDFKNDRAFFRAKQKHYKDFYKYLLQDEYKSNWLRNNLEKHQYVVDSLIREQTMTAKLKKKRAKNERRSLKKKGTGLKITKMLMLDPRYVSLGNEDIDDYNDALGLEKGFKAQVLGISNSEGIKAIPFFTAEMEVNDVEIYNDFAELKTLISEAKTFYRLDLKPPSIDKLLDLRDKLSVRYVCQVGGVILKDEHDSWYYISIYDLEEGKIVYRRKEDLNRKISLEELEEEFRIDLQRLKN